MAEQDQGIETSNDRAGLTSSLALLCATWFVLTAWFWTYFANLIFSYPVGLVGLLLWNKARVGAPDDKKNRLTITILAVGLAASVVSFFLYR